MASLVRGVGFAIMAFLAFGVALFSYRYLVPGAPGGAPEILANRFTHLGALTVHAGFAATALILGAFQFLRPLRARWPVVHRWMGTAYVVSVLLGGSAGLLLALGTTAGPVAAAGFGLLAITWLGATGGAWRLARARDFARHQRWMTRSYALTLAAVTLRIYMPLASAIGLDPAVSYVAISWLAWVPNLMIAELWLALGGPRTSPLRAATSRMPG
ncbi:MAG TPA: DUF2306 domain-containing protein [Caulobacteraceae bacterium]|nr:DUF2306 domain-containing protein [Caulobacteraceae bacterium]